MLVGQENVVRLLATGTLSGGHMLLIGVSGLAKTQAALLEAMQELSVTVSGKTYSFEPPFVVIATQNPIEQEGTYPLPEAQLDRFFLSIHVDYPSVEAELEIAARPARVDVPEMEPVGSAAEFTDLVKIVDHVPVARHVLEHAVSLTAASRPKTPLADGFIDKYVSWGAGPRATQHLVTAAKTSALLDGRSAPEVRDIEEMAPAVLQHRIIPSYSALGEGIDPATIVAHLVGSLKKRKVA